MLVKLNYINRDRDFLLLLAEGLIDVIFYNFNIANIPKINYKF